MPAGHLEADARFWRQLVGELPTFFCMTVNVGDFIQPRLTNTGASRCFINQNLEANRA
jgi:hypothetical protein